MTYEIAIDVFFFTDFCLDFFALYLAARLGKRRAVWKRLLPAAALGALSECLFFLYPVWPRPAAVFLTVVSVGGLMNAAAFPGLLRDPARKGRGFLLRGALRLLYADALLLAASVLLGGLFYAVRESLHLRYGEGLIFLAGLTALFGLLLEETTRERARGRTRYPVRLSFRGKCREFTALVDSGNRLRAPGTGAPVSIVSGRDCAGFFDELLAESLVQTGTWTAKGDPAQTGTQITGQDPVQTGIRTAPQPPSPGLLYIPYRAVGTERGLLPGVLLDKMEIVRETGVLTVRKPVVAIAGEALSADGDFSMLLPEELLLEK